MRMSKEDTRYKVFERLVNDGHEYVYTGGHKDFVSLPRKQSGRLEQNRLRERHKKMSQDHGIN